MKLAKFGILVNKTTPLFTLIRDSKISRGCAKILEIPEGKGVTFGGRFWKIQRGGGSYGKSLPWGGGGYGYFLEPHIAIVNVAGNKGMYQRFSTFFANIFPYPPDIVQIK